MKKLIYVSLISFASLFSYNAFACTSKYVCMETVVIGKQRPKTGISTEWGPGLNTINFRFNLGYYSGPNYDDGFGKPKKKKENNGKVCTVQVLSEIHDLVAKCNTNAEYGGMSIGTLCGYIGAFTIPGKVAGWACGVFVVIPTVVYSKNQCSNLNKKLKSHYNCNIK